MEAVKVGADMEYYRDTFLEIDLDHVYHNVTHLIQHYSSDITLMAVIKADSYGHGAIMVAKTLLEAGVRYFAVATLDEAIELRRAHIKCPILILGGVRIKDLKLIRKLNLSIGVHSLTWLEDAMAVYHGKPVRVHLKYDTGMGRLGLTDESAFTDAADRIRKSAHFDLKGVYSHLATAEETDENYYQYQVDRFEKALEKIDLQGLFVHIGNSAGSLKPKPEHINMVRVGLFINGVKPAKTTPLSFELKPSLSLYSKLVQVKTVKPRTKLSYNGIYETRETEFIGTIPIGYADGYDRRLQDGRVYINGVYCDIVGRICMDYCLVRLPLPFKEGTRVELIGEHVTIDEYAEKIKTNNYHATCQFSDRLPRIYLRHGKIIKIVNRRLMARIGGYHELS